MIEKMAATRFCAVLGILSLIFLSCTPRLQSQRVDSWVDTKETLGLFANRSIVEDDTIVIIELTEPAVLSVGPSANQSAVVEAIAQEQSQFIQNLKAISDRIQVIYTYQRVLNAIAVILPKGTVEKVANMQQVSQVAMAQEFSRLEAVQISQQTQLGSQPTRIMEKNSVAYIGTAAATEQGLFGKGVKVGIIDTGIDYTHAMLGGSGDKSVYELIDPAQPSNFFPNSKVVGGYDFVGSQFSTKNGKISEMTPVPDSNPIDESYHGTHVAGSVAGVGDQINSYSGVAPQAELYALKVFGKEGGTMDMAVIAALEYAADPNGDFDFSDKLDIVNLSLGGNYGRKYELWSTAIENLTQGGTLAVVSAGNSGDNLHVVGSPGTADDALSVAASVDDAYDNWQKPAVAFTIHDQRQIIEAVTGPINPDLRSLPGKVLGELFSIGLAKDPLSLEQIQLLNGKIALIDRGIISFEDKLKRAKEAGAIAAVVVNSESGPPLIMGGDNPVDLPATMISLELGNKIKQALANKEAVIFEFGIEEKYIVENFVGTIWAQSSRGPRVYDYAIKPEIAAPGFQVLSALAGSGSEANQLSGTSMASPHVSGVAALVKQRFPQLSARELKSLLMGSSQSLFDTKLIPIHAQGAGQVSVPHALSATVIAVQNSLSLGLVEIPKGASQSRDITLVSSNAEDLYAHVHLVTNDPRQFQLRPLEKIHLRSGEKIQLKVEFDLYPSAETQPLDGHLKVELQDASGIIREKITIPVLALTVKASDVRLKQKTPTAQGTQIALVNPGLTRGEAMVFRHIAVDPRKQRLTEADLRRDASCDLESAGYRVVEKLIKGKQEKVIQFAINLYDGAKNINHCEVSVLIDSKAEGRVSHELAATYAPSQGGVSSINVLLDYEQARDHVAKYEELRDSGMLSANPFQYLQAAIYHTELRRFGFAGFYILEAPLSALGESQKTLNVKIVTSASDWRGIETDDYLGDAERWWSIDSETDEFIGAAHKVQATIPVQGDVQLIMGKEQINQEYSLYAPANSFTDGRLVRISLP